MTSLLRNNISHGHSILYKSLGPLIKDYRQWRDLSQETLAASIKISVRELQNWEADRHRARIENLHDLAEVTGIPLQVCVTLNSDQPIWYSLLKRRFAYSSIEAQYLQKDYFRYREISGNRTFAKMERISTDKHITKILTCHRELYCREKPLGWGVFEAAIAILPDLNQIFFDSSGHYVGHNVFLPLSKEVYQQLKQQKDFEHYLTLERISDIISLREGVLFNYSSFASSLNVAHQIAIDAAQFLIKIEQKDNYLIAASVAPTEGKELFANMGMRVVAPREPTHAGSAPTMYEIELDKLMKPRGPLAALQRMIKKQGRKVESENLPGKIRREDLPTLLERSSNKLKPLYTFTSIKTMPAPDSLKADVPLLADDLSKTKKRLHFRQPIPKGIGNRDEQGKMDTKQQDKLLTETCVNSGCSLYSKTALGNIVYNGTHWTKEGIIVQRFLCKACGKSFCSRSRSIFYGLRSPEEKVRQALDLLAKGMSLRGVGRTLGVKTDTVRHWLKAAVERIRIDRESEASHDLIL